MESTRVGDFAVARLRDGRVVSTGHLKGFNSSRKRADDVAICVQLLDWLSTGSFFSSASTSSFIVVVLLLLNVGAAVEVDVLLELAAWAPH